MRLFDTPGYGSIYKEHEEVLKEFIPNSDVIIYVVNYRVGIGENDAEFLHYIEHFLQEDIHFFLVINRAPETAGVKDVRVKEIVRYAQDLWHSNVKYFIVPSIPGDGVKLPAAKELWTAVRQEVQSELRKRQVEAVLQNYQMNNIVEQDHRFIKKRVRSMLGLKTFRTVKQIICGVEAMHMLKNGQLQQGVKSVQSEVEFIHK